MNEQPEGITELCPKCHEWPGVFFPEPGQGHQLIIRCDNSDCPLIVELKGFYDASDRRQVKAAFDAWNREFEVKG